MGCRLGWHGTEAWSQSWLGAVQVVPHGNGSLRHVYCTGPQWSCGTCGLGRRHRRVLDFLYRYVWAAYSPKRCVQGCVPWGDVALAGKRGAALSSSGARPICMSIWDSTCMKSLRTMCMLYRYTVRGVQLFLVLWAAFQLESHC